MNDQYSSSRQHFLQFAGKSFTGNEKKSIENGVITMIGVEVPPLITTEQEFENLPFLMKRRYDNVCKEYDKEKLRLVKNLSTLYDNLLEACEPTLLEKIKRHHDFTFNDADGKPCAMALMLIIQDLCSSTAGINYLPEMGMTTLYDLLLIDGNSMTLQTYVEIFSERYDACKRMGYVFGTPMIQQGLLTQSQAYRGAFSLAHTELYNNIAVRAEEMVVTQIFFRQSGDKYEELRQKFKNDYRIENWNNFPTTIAAMSNLMENYKPLADSISKNIMKEINRRNNKKNDSKNRTDDDVADKGDDEPIPDKNKSGNTDETGKSFNQNGTPEEGETKSKSTDPKKDFRPDHPSAASGLSKEQRTQRPPAEKGGHTGTQRSQQQAGNRKSDQNRDTQRPQECGKKENPNDNNKTNNNKPHVLIIMINLILSAMHVRPWVATQPIKSAPYLGKR